jgi:hypothetical protein
MNVFVTGSAGLRAGPFGSSPIRIEPILALLRATFTHERYAGGARFASPLLARLLRDIQTAIHLAPAVGDEAAARGEVLQAAQNLYSRALAAIRTLIHLPVRWYSAPGETPSARTRHSCTPAARPPRLQAVEAVDA